MGAGIHPARVYHFGTFTLDARTGELAHDGRRIPLRDQSVQLLLALLEHPGELITREELARTDALAAGGAEARRAFEAMMPMKKIDIATIEAARRG